MRLKIIIAVVLLAVGVGAIGVVIVRPSIGTASDSTLLTAQVTRENVVDQVVATGSLAPSATYALAFGAVPTLASSSSSSNSGASSSNSGAGSSNITWPVKTVAVVVGQSVKQGDVLATADDVDATPQLAAAQANLSAAEAKLATDQGGATATEKAQAQLSITQADQQLANARTNYNDTVAKEKLAVQQAEAAVTAAKAQVTADKAASPPVPADQLSADEKAVTNTEQQLANTQQQATQAEHQASQSISSASLSVTSAKANYTAQTAAAPDATIDADKASVASAQLGVSTAQGAVDNATLVAPADGTVATVSIVAGYDAPSGTAMTVQSSTMVVSGDFAEDDINSLQVGQVASITVNAVNKTLSGKVTGISPTAASSGSSSVVTYPVEVTLDATDAPLRAGMSASIAVTTASVANAMAVPAIALNGTAGDYSVNVVGSDGIVSATAVQVGLVTASLAQITSGLTVGETVETGTTSARTGSTTTTGGTNFSGGFPGGGIITRGGFQP